MKLIERNHCVISGREDLELLYSFKDFPVFMGCVDHSPEDDLSTDMNWWISGSTGSLQLNPLIPLEILYSSEHGAGLIGCTMNSHHREFSDFILQAAPQKIIEIGGGHGLLAEHYTAKNEKAEWTILEPNPSRKYPERIRCIRAFFDEAIMVDESYDAIVHSHVLEHMYEPEQFIKTISEKLSNGKYMYFAVPQLKTWLQRGYFNAINFEHTLFLTESYIEYLLGKHGFAINTKKSFMGEHSIFYECVKTGEIKTNEVPSHYQEHKNIFEAFICNTKKFVCEVMSKVKSEKSKVYLFGGHIFSQFLLNTGMAEECITSILDNNQSKQNRRLYGTNLFVKSPCILKGEKSPIVVLKAGSYNQEIKDDILRNINPTTLFLE